ncbi:MAG: AgmX/PglI C-terminal domain-containing protein [Bdellovibrionales bacterium]|nr:AgmX/PglI C-terminal domain-containing protein [Oligoflexia bacterium]
MKKDYLVTTTVNDKSWSLIWDQEEALELDHPVYWELVHSENGVQFVHTENGSILNVEDEYLNGERDFELPHTSGEERSIQVNFKSVPRIRPAFLTSDEAARSVGPAEQYVSAGIREHLISFREFPEKSYVGDVVENEIFKLTPTNRSVHIVSKLPGVRFKPAREESRSIVPGISTFIPEKELLGGAFIYGSYWWRVNKVALPNMLDLDELDKEVQAQDLVSLQSLCKGFGTFLVVVLLAIRGLYFYNHMHDAELAKAPKVTEVELKKPKLIVKAPELPKPTPAKIVKAEPKPKPEKKKPEPKKVAKKEPPKLKKKPEPKIAKKEPPKKAPAKVVKREPIKEPPPRLVANPKRNAPVVPPMPVKKAPVVPRGPDPSLVAANEKAAVAKSLNFLSTGPSKNVAALATNPNAKASAKYANAGNGGMPGTTSKLSNLANQNTGDGPISTRGARGLASNSGIQGGHGKGLNDVQGKVAFNSLTERGSGDALGAALGGGSMSVTGPGKISDADIEKTLSRYLDKFQRCYEKALLSDPAISGEVQIRWTINPNGHVSAAQVVRSEMNKKPLHDCLTGVLGNIVFPAPKGGPATVKKPFRFKSSSF